MERGEIIAAIRSFPAELDALLSGLPDAQIRRRPTDDEWSLLEVCCHLRDSVAFEQERVQLLVTEDNPTLEAYDQEALATERRYAEDDIERVRRALSIGWRRIADMLAELPEGDWERAGLHPELGRVTVADRAERLPIHAREHFAQMRAMRERQM